MRQPGANATAQVAPPVDRQHHRVQEPTPEATYVSDILTYYLT
jgi:hypothetical protein